MDKRIYFSQEYITLIVNYYQAYLDREPSIKLCSTKTTTYIREYDGRTNKRKHQYKLSTHDGKLLLDRYEKNSKIQNLIDQYKTIWDVTYHIPIPVIDKQIMENLRNLDWNGSTIKFYDSLIPNQSNRLYERKYIHNQNPMASMLEIAVADILDELNLNYKYEPLIKLGNDTKLVDFFVAVPFINFAFPTEVAGMLNNDSYYDKFQLDMRKYYRDGYVPGENMLVLTTNDLFTVNNEAIAMTICNFINVVVHYALARAKNI